MTRSWIVVAGLLGLVAAACASESATLSGQAVVSSIPWVEREEARYQLVDGDEVRGSGVLSIESADGAYSFAQTFENDEFRDETTALADIETLRPKSVQRTIEGPEGTRRWEVEYSGNSVAVMQTSEEEERRDDVSVPSRSYDSWTDVFLWRTIDFHEGYEASYADVLTATLTKPKVISQTLKVTGTETVEVPAGTFEAWRLEISSSDGSQRAWYADTETRPLVRYDNGDLVFELLSVE